MTQVATRHAPQWNLYVRDNENAEWVHFKTTDDKTLVDLYIIELNDNAGYQRYALEIVN